MKQEFLGWDCANKTLAWSHVTVDLAIKQHIREWRTNTLQAVRAAIDTGLSTQHTCQQIVAALQASIQRAHEILDGFVQVHAMDTVDVLGGRKVAECNELVRTRALVAFLAGQPAVCANTTVLIEHQPSRVGMATNNKSTMVSHQLMMHYAAHQVVLVDPKLKNTIAPNDDLDFATFVAAKRHLKTTRTALYSARKTHAKAAFLAIMGSMNKLEATAHIKKSCLDDVADSFLQIIAHIAHTGGFEA